MTICKCDYCNKTILKSRFLFRKSKNHFCNTKCYSKWQSKYIKGEKHFLYKRKKIKCKTCNKVLYIIPSAIRKNNFCNERCYGIFRHKNFSGKNCPSYINGKSREPYTLTFYNKKYKIRERDNFECKNCGIIEEEHIIVFGRVLDVHHIDYNKKNDTNNNLISLCLSCNARANYNREQWKKYYQNKMKVCINYDHL